MNRLRPFATTLWILGFTGLGEYLLFRDSSTAIDCLFGIPMVLVIPGAALLRAFCPSKTRTSFGELVMWAVVGSVGISVLTGFVLNVAGGLTRDHWLIALATIVTTFSIVSLLREASGIVHHTNSEKHSPRERRWAVRPHFATIVAVTVASLIGVIAIVMSQLSVSASREHFAEIWLVPTEVQTTAVVDGPSANFGIKNYEGDTTGFVVSLYAGGSKVMNRVITLHDGAEWNVVVKRPIGLKLRATLRVTGRSTNTIQSVALPARGS
jgi:uncharacterized membrane protein